MSAKGKCGEFFTIAKPGDTLSGIVEKAFGKFPSHEAWMKKVAEVAERSHIDDPDHIEPGEVIALRGFTEGQVGPARPDLIAMRQVCRDLSADIEDHLVRNWDLLEFIASHGKSYSKSAGLSALSDLDKFVPGQMTHVKPPTAANRNYVQKVTHRFRNDLKEYRRASRELLRKGSLHASTQPIFAVSRDAKETFAANTSRLRRIAASARNLQRGFFVLDIYSAVDSVRDAAKTGKDPYREAVSQTGGLSLGVLGGAGAAYLGCNLLLGLPSGGWSLIGCAALVGAGGGIAAKSVGERGYGALYDLAKGNNGKALEGVTEKERLPDLVEEGAVCRP